MPDVSVYCGFIINSFEILPSNPKRYAWFVDRLVTIFSKMKSVSNLWMILLDVFVAIILPLVTLGLLDKIEYYEVLEKVFKVEIKKDSREKVKHDLDELREKQIREEKRLKDKQVFGRGQEIKSSSENKESKAPLPSMSNLRSKEDIEKESKLNRNQRRMLKKMAKKEQKI